MLPTPELIETLDKRFGSPWLSNDGDQVNVICPHCHKRGMTPDLSGHLGLNFRINKAHCTRCDWGFGDLSKYLSQYGVAQKVRYEDVRKSVADILSFKNHKQLKPELQVSDVEFPQHIERIDRDQDDQFTKSLYDKGIDMWDIQKHRLCYCDTGWYENYVMFPFIEDQEIVYWQGRAATKKLLEDPKKKKKNPSEKECPLGKANWLYGYQFLRKKCKIYLTEGSLDQISLQRFLWETFGLDGGHYAVSLQGTALSFPSETKHPFNSQWGKIRWHEPEEVIVVFDDDAWKKAKALSELLSRTGLIAKYAKLSGGDPNEIIRAGNGNTILNSIRDPNSALDGLVQDAEDLESFTHKI